uniref:Ubiquitin-like protease family profile domain-containing protein n=1 Tax=Knipowitschia caucasica TaxID=637954 RepID=A0AAV2LQM5_KNICA
MTEKEKKSEVAGRMEVLHIAHSLSPGPWRELGVNDVQGLTKQGCSNNCGVFVLMYTLYIVMGANCDFREENMLQIRRCLQADYEEFCKEMMDKRQLQVFSGFEMR